MFDDRKQRALEWLYLELKITKFRLGHAERKCGVKLGELDGLRGRIENIETCIECVRAAEGIDNEQ